MLFTATAGALLCIFPRGRSFELGLKATAMELFFFFGWRTFGGLYGKAGRE